MGWLSSILDIAANYDIFRSYESTLTAWEAAYNTDFDKIMLVVEKQNADYLNSLL